MGEATVSNKSSRNGGSEVSWFGAARVTSALGTPIILDSAISLDISATIDNGFLATLNSSDSPFLTVAAGRYALPEFAQTVASQLKQWFKNAADADPNVVIASADDVDLTLAFAPVIGVNTSRFSLTLRGTNFTIKGGGGVSVTSLTIPSTHSQWASLLGLAGTGQSASGTTSGSECTIFGTHQPRSFFALPGSYQAPGHIRKRSERTSHVSASGKAHQYVAGGQWREFPFQLFNLPTYFAGPDKPAGRCKSYSLVSSVPTLKTANPTLLGTSGFADVYISKPLFETGVFIQCGSWYSRIHSTSFPTAPTDNSINWYEAPPGNEEEAPSQFKPIHRISEAMALKMEAERTGQLIFYQINEETGAQRWDYNAYTLGGNGEAEDRPERFSSEIDAYSLDFGNLIEDRDPQLIML